LNLNGTVLHPAYNIGLKAQIFKRANGYKPWVVKAELDICRFVKKTYNPVAIIVFNLFKEFSNFNHSCPFVASIKSISIISILSLDQNYLTYYLMQSLHFTLPGITNRWWILSKTELSAAHYSNWRLFAINDLAFW